MRLEISTLIQEVLQYLTSAWITVNPLIKWMGAIWAYALFPTESYITYAQILLYMVVIDLVSKYYAISVTNGGFKNALKTGRLSSTSMWVGTRRKLVGYFIIMILVGLAYRFEALQAPAEFMGTLVYSVMFFREAQSVLENMIDAGHEDLRWLLFFIKKKEKEVLGNVGIENDIDNDGEKHQKDGDE